LGQFDTAVDIVEAGVVYITRADIVRRVGLAPVPKVNRPFAGVVGALIDPFALGEWIDRMCLGALNLGRIVVLGNRREVLVGVLRILGNFKPKMLHVGLAGGTVGILSYFLKSGKQYCCEDHDNGDNDDQLNQRKALS
jgi:hypothetical protein